MTKKDTIHRTVYNAMRQYGLEAGYDHVPTPMVVEGHANQLDDNSPVVQRWYESEGVCGFAGVIVKPGTSSFARWLIKHDLAHKHYYGGVMIWVHDFGQSYERKIRFANAAVKYLRSIGINAYTYSRLD